MTNTMTMTYIKIDKIETRLQPRSDATPDAELVDSIRERGILTPIAVWDNEMGGYCVLSGHRRLAAAKQGGLEDVPCIIQPKPSISNALAMAVAENVHRAPLSKMEMAWTLRCTYLLENLRGMGSEAYIELPTTTTGGSSATEQLQFLAELEEIWACELDDQGGLSEADARVQSWYVPWRTICEMLGMSALTDRERRRTLDLLKLAPEIQEELFGESESPPSGSVLERLSRLDVEDQLNLLAEKRVGDLTAADFYEEREDSDDGDDGDEYEEDAPATNAPNIKDDTKEAKKTVYEDDEDDEEDGIDLAQYGDEVPSSLGGDDGGYNPHDDGAEDIGGFGDTFDDGIQIGWHQVDRAINRLEEVAAMVALTEAEKNTAAKRLEAILARLNKAPEPKEWGG